MSRPRDKRFSIDDAFEEEPSTPIPRISSTAGTTTILGKHPKNDKCTEDTISRDSESLILDYAPEDHTSPYCWKHPKVRENWKVVVVSVILSFIGIVLLIMGVYDIFEPDNKVRGAVFVIIGLICFVPGVYHVVYIWLAARGHRGYDFYHLPLFT